MVLTKIFGKVISKNVVVLCIFFVFWLVTLPNIDQLKFVFTDRLSNKPFLIWSLTTSPHLKYVATLPCNLTLTVHNKQHHKLAILQNLKKIKEMISNIGQKSGTVHSRLNRNHNSLYTV